jgi:hypothetical protein
MNAYRIETVVGRGRAALHPYTGTGYLTISVIGGSHEIQQFFISILPMDKDRHRFAFRRDLVLHA